MSRDFPALIDPLQLVKSRRGFKGTWPLAKLGRLTEMLARPDGEVAFEMQFARDQIGTPYVEIGLTASPWLLCQRTLEPFEFPVEREVRLGLITSEEQEASLPPGYEPLLLTEEPMRVTDLVEDELILALPLVPRRPGDPLEAGFGELPEEDEEESAENPFSALAALKGGKDKD